MSFAHRFRSHKFNAGISPRLGYATQLCTRYFSSSCRRENNYYDTLDLPQTATKAEITTRYVELLKKYHQDYNPDPEARADFDAVILAGRILRDPRKRKAYDQKLKTQEASAARSRPLPPPQPRESPRPTVPPKNFRLAPNFNLQGRVFLKPDSAASPSPQPLSAAQFVSALRTAQQRIAPSSAAKSPTTPQPPLTFTEVSARIDEAFIKHFRAQTGKDPSSFQMDLFRLFWLLRFWLDRKEEGFFDKLKRRLGVLVMTGGLTWISYGWVMKFLGESEDGGQAETASE